MVPQDNLSSVPRRALDVEDYIDILRRHKGWIFGPFLFSMVAAVVGVYLYPDTFESKAVIKVVPQQLPETLVPSTINRMMTDRISSMAQSILSRGTLTSIINQFQLYPRERTRLPIDDIVESMRKDIQISPVSSWGSGDGNRQVSAFQVKYSYENRYQAQKVVEDLVRRFMDQNTREGAQSATSVANFLRDEWEIAKKDLDDIEGRLAQFRLENMGRLPEQMQANMGQMTALQQQVTNINSIISRVQQEKLVMESNIRIFQDQLKAAREIQSDPVTLAQQNTELAQAERELTATEARLALLRQTYTDSHPDVIQLKAFLERTKKKRDDLLKDDEKNKAAGTPAVAPRGRPAAAVREAQDLEANIRRLQSALEVKDLEIENYKKDLTSLSTGIKSLQGRIEGTPISEKQYQELLRDRDLARQRYQDLDGKKTRGESGQKMESRAQGERLELLDQASLPQTPTEPKRPMVIGMGAVAGLVLGLVFAGAREMKDSSLKNLKDVRAYTQLPILGSVPLLENDFVVRRRRRIAWLAWTTACLAGVVIMSGSVVYYYVTRT